MKSIQFSVDKIILGDSFYMKQPVADIEMFLLNFLSLTEFTDFGWII